MKKTKQILCGTLSAALLLTGTIGVSAQTIIRHTQNSIVGDADNDNVVKINDATLLQKQLAEISTELDVTNAYTHAVLDANQDNNISIGDVTEIQRYLAELPVAHVSKAIPTTSPVTEPVTQTTTQPVTQPTTQPTTTAHTHVYTTTVEKKLVEESYTFHDGGEWEMHVFCRKCGEDLTIMHKKWMEENDVKQGDFYADLASWFQKKHNKTTLMKSPTTGKLCAVTTDCQGELWGSSIGKPYDNTKTGAYQDWVYIGGQEYTYPAIYKYIYTEKCACGDVKRVYAKQTAYPSRADIVAGTYTEKLVDVEP